MTVLFAPTVFKGLGAAPSAAELAPEAWFTALVVAAAGCTGVTLPAASGAAELLFNALAAVGSLAASPVFGGPLASCGC